MVTGPVQVLVAINLELEFCAKTYCGARNTDDLAYEELAELIVAEYAHIGVSEIRGAFRAAAAGKLGDIDLNAYYGQFSGTMLGRLLTAYDTYRKTIIADLQKFETKKAVEPQGLTEYQEAKLNHDAYLFAVERLLAKQCTESNVYVSDYNALEKLGLINLTSDEKKSLYAGAIKLVNEKQKSDALDIDISTRTYARRILENIVAGIETPDMKVMYSNTAKKLAVVQWRQNIKIEQQ